MELHSLRCALPDAEAKLVEMKQPDLSKLLRGQFRLVSVEKLMRMLTAIDQDVEITLNHVANGEELVGSLSSRPRRTSEADGDDQKRPA